jgi:putative nucleotidyltransferase with HDIG domain
MGTDGQPEIRPRKILVGQQDPQDRDFLRLFLDIVGGYEILEAADGIGLIKQLKRRPDMILMDTSEEGRFLRALEIVRRTPVVRDLPVIIYSSDQGKLAETVGKGVDGFVINPSPPATLLGKIWRILGQEAQKEAEPGSFANRYKRDVETIDNLPTLPTVYAEVDRLCQDPDVAADDLSKVIQTDPSITLKLLNLSNSAFFGFSRRINSVRDAISLLGNQTVRNTILNIAIFEATKDIKESAGLDRNQFWLHSAGVGSAARYLSTKLKINREEAFTAGIVHDMGKIILDGLYTEFYADVLAKVAEGSLPIGAAEKEVVGLDHGEIGLELAEAWNLPPELVAAVSCHHRPARAEQQAEIAALTHLGNVICRKLGVGSGGDDHVPEFAPFALNRLNVTLEQLEEWEPEMQEAIDRDKAILSILKS